MKTSEIHDLCIKLFGLYCLTRFLLFIPHAILIFSGSEWFEKFTSTPAMLITFVMPITYIVITWMCIFKTCLITKWLWGSSSDDVNTLESPKLYSFWIALIGFFYCAKSTPSCITLLYVIHKDKEKWDEYLFDYQNLPMILLFPVSIFCILQAKNISAIVFKSR